jgi:uncharacterized protein (TIGR03435 family)
MKLSATKCITAALFVASLAPPLAVGQKPTFDVASIKLAVGENGPRNRFIYNRDGVNIGGCTLAFIIAEAYDYPLARLQGPGSLTKESLWKPLRQGYDIAAKADHPVSKDQLRLMLQSLLHERVGLTMHHESRTAPVYSLSVAKNGPKLEKAEGEEFSVSVSSAGFVFRNTSMVRLISFLSGRLDRPVIDGTGLTGLYNFVLKSSDDPAPDSQLKKSEETPSPDTPSSAIFDESLKRLGLQLVKAREAIDYLVVDQVTPPSAN